jgi:hypothetical protein
VGLESLGDGSEMLELDQVAGELPVVNLVAERGLVVLRIRLCRQHGDTAQGDTGKNDENQQDA